MKCLIETKERKIGEGKAETKKKGNKQKTVPNVVDTNPTISVMALNVNELNTATERQSIKVGKNQEDPRYFDKVLQK